MLRVKYKSLIFLLIYAIPNTALSFGILFIINNVLGGNEEFLKSYMIIVFLATVIYAYLLNIIFQKKLNKYTFKMLYENEKILFKQILKAPLQTIEKFGTQRFYTAIEDLRIFSDLPYTVTHTVSSLLMLALGVIYMFMISSISAIIVLVLIVLVAVCYFIVMNSMSNQIAQLRSYNENYFSLVQDLISGFKELKISTIRRKNMMNKFLGPNRDKSEDLDYKVNYIFLSINMISQYGLYLVIAAVIFVLPAFEMLEREDVIAYVVVILFISGPINNLINLQQNYTSFMVANTRIKNFMKDFQVNGNNKKAVKKEKLQAVNSIKFNDIYFDYPSKKNEKTFALGPINLEIKQGEVIFIVGGNGSGKSTFINVLTGLYEASKGDIIINGEITKDIHELEDSIAAVFSNNHIFANNYDNYTLKNNKEYKKWLEIMQLDKVIVDDQEESARRELSKGQGKRISMILALLEDKPILILDEWAADQDPYFRKFFYEELLPKLKEEGKTIIAVTHDDAYFHLANS